MASIQEQLQRAGLTGNESKLYFELLNLGEAHGHLLARQTGLDRSLTYTILNNLIEKGLVSYVIKNKKRLYRPANPKNLLVPIKEQEALVQDLIPKLLTVKAKDRSESQVRVFEGKEGLKVLFEEAFRSKNKEWLFFGGTWASFDVLKWEMPHIVTRALKKKLQVRGIISDQAKDADLSLVPNSKIRVAPGINSNATTTICGDQIAIHVLVGKPLIIIIKNKEIANGYKAYFEFMWKISKKLQ